MSNLKFMVRSFKAKKLPLYVSTYSNFGSNRLTNMYWCHFCFISNKYYYWKLPIKIIWNNLFFQIHCGNELRQFLKYLRKRYSNWHLAFDLMMSNTQTRNIIDRLLETEKDDKTTGQLLEQSLVFKKCRWHHWDLAHASLHITENLICGPSKIAQLNSSQLVKNSVICWICLSSTVAVAALRILKP